MSSLPAPHAKTVAHDDDIGDWVNRFKAVAADHKTVTTPAAPQAKAWHNRMLEFFNPIDTAVITCCCPGITFGKTHHRLRKNANMQDYSPINVSCLGFCCLGCCGINLAMQLLQRHEIRSRFRLQGNLVEDVLRTCCCLCCSLVQQEKEAEYQLANGGDITMTQPTTKTETMAYEPTAPTTA